MYQLDHLKLEFTKNMNFLDVETFHAVIFSSYIAC